MKAYVIKNKEGKYYSRNLLNPDNFLFENRIVACELFATEEIAKFEITFNELKDCEVVEVTIAEGDLEKENKLLRKALELACNITNLNYITGYKPEHFIQQAKEELKDENIGRDNRTEL